MYSSHICNIFNSRSSYKLTDLPSNIWTRNSYRTLSLISEKHTVQQIPLLKPLKSTPLMRKSRG